MCSINGFSYNDEDLIKKITLSNKYRGPDATTFHINKSISFGFNLLAFTTDPEKSSQPIICNNKKIVLMFNGEIYNLERLKKKLDIKYEITEVEILLKLYQIYRNEMFKLIDGMFAIAIFNEDENKIILCRDSLGIKPLYYFTKNGKFYFSSDLNSLFKINLISRKIDLRSLKKYLIYGVNFGEQSFYEDIKKVNPTEILTFDLKKKNINQEYFKPNVEKQNHSSIFEDINDSVVETLKSKRKPCLLISGGLDSNIIYALAKFNGIELNTVSSLYEPHEDIANSDALSARKIVDKYNHNEIYINFKRYLELIDETPAKLHEPKYNKNLEMQNEVFYQMANNGIKLAITGDGADELFSGYKSHLINYFFNFKKFYNSNNFSYLIETLGRRKFLQLIINSNEFKVFDSIYNPQRIFDKNINNDLNTIVKRYSNKNNKYSNFTILELYTIVLEDFLMTKDNLGMAYSIEGRFPFLNSFREKILDLDPNNKIDIKNNVFKKCLRDTFKDILPDIVLNKKNKVGWSIPSIWRTNDTYKKKISDILSDNYMSDFNNYFKEEFSQSDMSHLSNKLKTKIIHFKSWAKSHNAYL